MEYIPVGKRTRLQKALKQEKSEETSSRKKLRKKQGKDNGGNRVAKSGFSSSDDEVCLLIDETEFLKAVSSQKSEKNSTKEDVRVRENSKLGKFDDDHGESSVGLEDKGKRIMNDDGNNGVRSDEDDDDGNDSVPVDDADDGSIDIDADDSVYIDITDDDDVCMDDADDDNVSTDDNDDDNVSTDAAVADDDVSMYDSDRTDNDGVHIVDFDYVDVDNYGVNDGDNDVDGDDDVNDADDDVDDVNDVDDDDVNDGDDGGKRGEDEPNVVFRRKVFEGMVLPADPANNNEKEKDFIGKRTRSHYKPKSSSSKRSKDGTISLPITIDIEDSSSSSSSSSLSNDEEVVDFKPKTHEKSGNVVKRKRGRPPKNKDNKLNNLKARALKRQKTNKVQNDLMNAILENNNEANVSSVSEAFLPLKFRFGGEKVQPKALKEDQELEGLFKEMDFALGVCDIGSQTTCLDDNEDDNVVPHDSVSLNEQLCLEGKEHYWIQDDEIGIKCKFCSIVKLEIRYVMPDFNEDPFGKQEGGNRYYGQFPYDNINMFSDRFQFPDFSFDSRDNLISLDATQEGTVWDLIPGTRRTLYPHQRDAFEFIWKNIGGGIRIDELSKLTDSGTGGCIICHAPGTGKTRLAIVFLQSFMKKYSNSKPLILAPYSMLRTWEEEFARWNVDIPFYNLNEKELSGKEDGQLLKVCAQHGRTVKDENIIRMIKLDTWKKGKGVLAVSYGLFQRLAHKNKDTGKKVMQKGVDKKMRQILDQKIRQALLEQPDVLVLDEGHTPRNENSSIFKVLSKVSTKRRVMLTGTPFQNNFEELHNTIALVREEFGVLFSAQLDNDDRKIEVIRKQFEPFVHVHKGEILRETLPGLFHSLIVLKPSELQKIHEGEAIIDQAFNDPRSEARVLLASTKACCEGINLVGASRVVLLDVVWNPSVERQAISRAYRLGQKKDVFVYHLITSGTLEEEKYRRQAAKERFGELLFSSSSPSLDRRTMHKKSIESKVVSKDHILEAMIQHDKTKYLFEKIICQPKTDDLITSFGPRSL
ncbi:SNF2 domain-containing protein CLASSY 3 [Bienertia sinuspersici]